MKAVILRLLEIVVTSVVVLLFAPLMLVIAIAIVIESGFPVFYMSPRIGKDGQHFDLFYFRTMEVGSAPKIMFCVTVKGSTSIKC